MKVQIYNPECYDSWKDAKVGEAVYTADLQHLLDSVPRLDQRRVVARLLNVVQNCLIGEEDTLIFKLEE